MEAFTGDTELPMPHVKKLRLDRLLGLVGKEEQEQDKGRGKKDKKAV